MADKEINIVSICGSLRKGSFNRMLMQALPALAPEGMRITEAPPYDKVPHYNFDDQEATGFPDTAEAWAAAIRNADGFMITTPEYNWTIPGTLKNVIDWASRMKAQPFRGRPVAMQSASPGLLGGARAQFHLRESMTGMGALVFGTPEVILTFAGQKFDVQTGELKDEAAKDVIRKHLEGFAKFVRMVGANK
jgi:chromate reductase, NAD(P)H dehydrogenase (quinone)